MRGGSDYVYFRRGDRPGLLRRIVSVVIDAGVVATAWGLAASLLGDAVPGALLHGGLMAVTLGYLIGLKAAGIGTAGQWVMRVRLLDYRGKAPAVWRVAALTLAAPSVFFVALVYLAWVVVDPDKTTLLDKLFGLQLVNRGAAPAGRGRRRWVLYTMNAVMLPCSEVTPAVPRPRRVEIGPAARPTAP